MNNETHRERKSTVKQTLPAYFGEFGGMFVGDLLVPALEELEQAFIKSQDDEDFLNEFSLMALAFTHNGVVRGSSPRGPTNIPIIFQNKYKILFIFISEIIRNN